MRTGRRKVRKNGVGDEQLKQKSSRTFPALIIWTAALITVGPQKAKRMKAAISFAICALVLFGCSQRYGIRVLNRSTNELGLLAMSWDGAEVAFPPVASVSADYSGAYGAPSTDLTLYPRSCMPTKNVLVSYLTVGGSVTVTNSVRIVIPDQVLEAVRHSHSNFMFVVNTDNSITVGISPDTWSSGPTSR